MAALRGSRHKRSLVERVVDNGLKVLVALSLAAWSCATEGQTVASRAASNLYDRLRPGIGIVELFEHAQAASVDPEMGRLPYVMACKGAKARWSFSADEDDAFDFQVSMIGSDWKTIRETYSWKKPDLLRYLSSNGKDCRCSVGFGGWEVNVVIDGQGKITTIEEPRNL